MLTKQAAKVIKTVFDLTNNNTKTIKSDFKCFRLK